MKRVKYIFLIVLLIILNAYSNIYAGDSESRAAVDPVMHYTISGYFTFANCMLLTHINKDMKLPVKYTITAVSGLLPGFIKEYYDEASETNAWDWNDIYFNSAGVASAIILHYFIFDKPAIKKKSVAIDIRDNGFIATCTIRF